MAVEATVMRAGAPDPPYVRSWVYRGQLTNYFDLARNDAAEFRAQLASAESAIAWKAASDLLKGGPAEVHDGTLQPEGGVWSIAGPADIPTVKTVDPAGIPLTDWLTAPATPAAPAASGPPG